MKYSDILQFEPITDIIQLGHLTEENYRTEVVRTFVYPEYFIETIIPNMVSNLNFTNLTARNRKGIQIIGNYGSGKSHLMSLVSLIAEDSKYLEDVSDDRAKGILQPIAGKYMVKRFEMSQTMTLWDIITYQLQNFLNDNGVDYHFNPDSPKMYSDQLSEMMAAFEDKYPDKGFLLVIDEMLVYLKVQASKGRLDQELMVLQALGQQCSRGRFGFMFGVQEKIYNAKEFTFATEMLLKVKDRYTDLTIRREDVSFVVQNRLLRKSPQQKSDIRRHLGKFRKYFSELQSRFEEYVDLFPVHPSYLENFENIKLERAQREILKTLTSQFDKIKDLEIPEDNPGLITYDTYWDYMKSDRALMAYPDFKTVSDIVSIIYGKIDSNFVDKRKIYKGIAKRIVNSSAIKILQGDLSKENGTAAETLVEDLCPMNPLAEDNTFLINYVDSVAQLIVKSTSGQYFDKNSDNGEYHLRTSGGTNFDQLIVDYAESMSDAQKDEAFFAFLIEILGIQIDSYRTGFRIYTHELEWRSHKVNRDGYIFFGHPDEKSTTHPKQHFYMIFMPVFQADKKTMHDCADEVYFVMDSLSDEFKDLVVKYGAAQSLWHSADSVSKPHYLGKKEDLFKKTRGAFETCYLAGAKVYYKGSEPRPVNSFSLPGEGVSKMEIFDRIASDILEDQFCEETPYYPAFMVNQTISKSNKVRYLKGALSKIARPTAGNKDGEDILTGLGCYKAGELVVDDSIYAQSILDKLNSRDRTIVVNRDEILEMLPKSDNIWYTKDHQLDADFNFMVLLVLVSLGECDVTLSNGRQINASNIYEFISKGFSADVYYSFSNIKKPKDVNIPVLKEIFTAFCGSDLTNQLDQKATFASLIGRAQETAADCASFEAKELRNGLCINGIEVIDPVKSTEIKSRVSALKGFCDQLSKYGSEAMIKHIPWDLETVRRQIDAKKELVETRRIINLVKELDPKISYLKQTEQYLPANSKLLTSIGSTIDKLPDVLSDMNESAVSAYNNELDDLKANYIKWYLDIYHRNCLTDLDNNVRTAILNSMEYQVCTELSKCALINTSDWKKWLIEFNQFKIANPYAETTLQSTPSVGFNPTRDVKTETRTIREMRQDLEEIYASWIDNLKDLINTEESQASIEFMDQFSQEFLNSFAQGLTSINDQKIANRLLRLLDDLTAGYEKVEISAEELVKCIPTPVTYEEAKARIEVLLGKKCSGKDRNKVRIVIR